MGFTFHYIDFFFMEPWFHPLASMLRIIILPIHFKRHILLRIRKHSTLKDFLIHKLIQDARNLVYRIVTVVWKTRPYHNGSTTMFYGLHCESGVVCYINWSSYMFPTSIRAVHSNPELIVGLIFVIYTIVRSMRALVAQLVHEFHVNFSILSHLRSF